MPRHSNSTLQEEKEQENGKQDDWTKEVVPRLPSPIEEQARKLKAFERSRAISSATDLLRGLLAYVFIVRSFQQLGKWSVLTAVADVSANDWRKRLRKANDWLNWLLQEVLAKVEPLPLTCVRGGIKRILLVDGTHWKCLGPKGIVMRVHTAFDLLTGRLAQVKVTDNHESEHLEVFDLQDGNLVVTDRANGLRKRMAFVLSKLAHIIVRISPSKFPMEDEQGNTIVLIDWLKGLHVSAGMIRSREVWIRYAKKRIKLRLVVFRLTEEQQQKAERRTKRKASKSQQKVQPNTLYFSGWVLVVTTLPTEQWHDQQILRLYQARWHIELLFKRMKQFLGLQTLRCTTLETAQPTVTALLIGWALLEQESATMRRTLSNAMRSVQETEAGKPLGKLITAAAFWQDDLDDSLSQADLDDALSEWMLTEASFDLFCQQIRGSYTAERFRACLPRLQRFLRTGHRKRPYLYSQVSRWLKTPETLPKSEDQPLVA
jgi:hypothetical protein